MSLEGGLVNHLRRIKFLIMLLALVGCGGGGGSTSPTFSFSGTAVTVNQGSFNQSNISTAFSAGATDTVTFSLESPPPGITGNFNPPSVNPSSPNTVLSLNVTASVPPGGYDLTIRGTSGSRVNTAKIKLTVDTLGSGGGGGDTLTLQATGGPINLGGSEPSGTLVVYRLLLGGELIDDPVNLTLTGPSGWNEGKTLTGEVLASSPNNILPFPGIEAVSGTYTLAIEVAGETVSASFAIDAAPKLPQTQGIEVEVTETAVNIGWAAVQGAGSYLVNVVKVQDGAGVASGVVKETTVSLDPNDLGAGNYRVLLYALSADLTGTAALPAQINASVAASQPFEVTGGGGGGGDFSITLRFNGTVSASQREAFQDAAAQWATIITESTGSVENISISEDDCDFVPYQGPINNLLIDLRITDIDGPGNILGQAGPCLFWEENDLPAYGIMEFDSADAEALEAKNEFGLVVLHEMGHVLGFGSIWENSGKDVLDEPCRSNQGATAGFKGPGAVAQFGVLGGDGNPPIENNYGPGTRCSHWDEGYFDNELMTGFLGSSSGEPVAFSALTIASMGDLGYAVNLGAAEEYTVPNCSPTCDDPGVRGFVLSEPWEVVLKPKGTVDSKGNIEFFQDDR
jgi:Leishmanolysin